MRTAWSPGTSPTAAYSNGQAAAVHISPKQLHCFSHNDGARVRFGRGVEKGFVSRWNIEGSLLRQRETISQSLLRTILTVKNFDVGVQMREHGAAELIATVFALRETALPMNLVKSRK